MANITPFHFICHTENRLRAQMEALDPALAHFIEIERRINIEENHSQLQFGRKPDLGEEFSPHVVFKVTLVPQKDNKVAFNCNFSCPAEDTNINFRLLMRRPEEAEMQIMKLMEMLQKAFGPLNYTENLPDEVAAKVADIASKPKEPESVDDISEEELAAILDTGDAAPEIDLAALAQEAEESETKTEAAADTESSKKKYYVEDPHAGEEVRLKDASGQYVPHGELPAKLRINKEKK